MSVADLKQAEDDGARAGSLLARAAAATAAARVRIDAAVADLTTARGTRIGAAARMDLARLFAACVAAVEDDLRERLIVRWTGEVPATLVESLAAAELAIAAPVLDRAGLLGDGELVAVLLRRVEAHRLREAMRAAEPPATPILDELLQGEDEPAAALAMGLLAAQSRRPNGLDGSGIAATELPAELQHRLVWRVAAALRHHILLRAPVPPAETDRALVAAVIAALSGYDEDDSAEGRAMQLARRLHQRRRLDEALVVRAFAESEVTLAAAMLAVRAAIDFAAAWEMVADPDGSRIVLLLRATGIGEAAAATILHDLAVAGIGDIDLTDRLDAFDRLDPLDAADALRPWQADPGYRHAIAELADGLARGGRR